MSDKKRPHARKPYNASSNEASAPEPADPESGGDTDPSAAQAGHIVTLDETLTNVKGSGQRDAEKPHQLDAIAFPQKDLERLQRIVSAPWLQSYAASNIPLANMTDSLGKMADLDLLKPHISTQLLESVNRALKVATPDVSQMQKVLGDALLPLGQMQLQQNMSLKPISDALTKFMETSLRHATFAGFAKRTQEWLTTTETLRYRSNTYVWHYTNGYACLSIIRSGNLWASSPESLNDASEMTHGLTLIREAFSKVKDEAKEDQDYDPDGWETVDLLMPEVLDAAYFDTILNEVYYISASSQPDSLTLWRNYANGDGFALGLSTKIELSADGIALDDEDDNESLRDDIPPISGWYRVTYKKNQKERLAKEFIQNAIEDIDRAGERDQEALVKELRKQAVILASVMKHDAFEDEKEVRWITTNFTNFDPVHYEHGRRSIVPVLHVRTASQDEEALLPLRGVRCSPVAPDGIVRTIQGLLAQMDYRQASSNVKKSEQPFKG
ncbi:DUF2971 domain-containing protein [Pseudarthrobacter sp. fls2-241-R2A-168]|uniref:DUF2971 domain-containing protein n=1 Tax=Pseudarthrobacter sp. fls2-241-R2A-168 TaxID=3040304 RepID=UPI00255445C2|nr:DUF2971 domain-containing protein [Pseudarthrobacter sp. fls2-241-R2A-168]